MFRVGVGEVGRGVASLKLSGGGLESSVAGEDDSSSENRLKSSWSLRGEEWRGRLPGGRGGLAWC